MTSGIIFSVKVLERESKSEGQWYEFYAPCEFSLFHLHHHKSEKNFNGKEIKRWRKFKHADRHR